MIKNIIFDIGNVLVKWAPEEAVKKIFPNEDSLELTKKLFKSQPWLDLNLGKITEQELIEIYSDRYGIDKSTGQRLMVAIKENLTPIPGSFELFDDVIKAGYNVYSITDNVKELIIYLNHQYDFWKQFLGVAVSAEIGILKPSKEIYLYLLEKYNLQPAECVFLDDLQVNVEGAQKVGMSAIQFISAAQCRKELKSNYFVNI